MSTYAKLPGLRSMCNAPGCLSVMMSSEQLGGSTTLLLGSADGAAPSSRCRRLRPAPRLPFSPRPHTRLQLAKKPAPPSKTEEGDGFLLSCSTFSVHLLVGSGVVAGSDGYESLRGDGTSGRLAPSVSSSRCGWGLSRARALAIGQCNPFLGLHDGHRNLWNMHTPLDGWAHVAWH
jgi:hypothetical protein